MSREPLSSTSGSGKAEIQPTPFEGAVACWERLRNPHDTQADLMRFFFEAGRESMMADFKASALGGLIPDDDD